MRSRYGQRSTSDLEDREVVLSRLARMTAGELPGALLEVEKLRGVVGRTLDKDRFDRAVLGLRDRGVVRLHHHDFPLVLRRQGRLDGLVREVKDDEIIYYVGIVLTGGPR